MQVEWELSEPGKFKSYEQCNMCKLANIQFPAPETVIIALHTEKFDAKKPNVMVAKHVNMTPHGET